MYGFTLGFKSKRHLPERAVPDELELALPWCLAGIIRLESSVRNCHLKCTGNSYREKLVLKGNLTFFRLTLGILVFISANINLLCPEANWYHIFPLCLVTLPHVVSSWPLRQGPSELTF